MVLPWGTGYVEYFDVCLQSSLVGSKCAIRTVKQYFALKNVPMYIAEVVLVAWVVLGGKMALCAAKWLWSVVLMNTEKGKATALDDFQWLSETMSYKNN